MYLVRIFMNPLVLFAVFIQSILGSGHTIKVISQLALMVPIVSPGVAQNDILFLFCFLFGEVLKLKN